MNRIDAESAKKEEADSQQKVLSAGLNCQLIGLSEFPLGSMRQRYAELGKLSGLTGVRYSIHFMLQLAAMNFRELPDAIKAAGVDALIYALMVTLQNRQQEIFNCIAEACVGLDAQLVISLGGGSSPESLQGLPGNPLVVGYAPQL
jgi:hypothetical protein